LNQPYLLNQSAGLALAMRGNLNEALVHFGDALRISLG
jgi:hypothetical protein